MNEVTGHTPQCFWSVFRDVVGEAIYDGPDWKVAWRTGGAAWSQWIFPLLRTTFSHLGYSDPRQVEQERHGRIDFTLVASAAPVASGLLDGSRVEIAVEHENGPSKWDDEWRKLQRFPHSRLRVVIGYSQPANVARDIGRAEEIMRTAAAPDDRPMLLIVGPVNGMTGEEFRAWEWRNGGFHALLGKIVLPDIPEPPLGSS